MKPNKCLTDGKLYAIQDNSANFACVYCGNYWNFGEEAPECEKDQTTRAFQTIALAFDELHERINKLEE